MIGKIGPNNEFFAIFFRNFFGNFRKLSGLGGGSPQTPCEAGHNIEPLNFFPAYVIEVNYAP